MNSPLVEGVSTVFLILDVKLIRPVNCVVKNTIKATWCGYIKNISEPVMTK